MTLRSILALGACASLLAPAGCDASRSQPSSGAPASASSPPPAAAPPPPSADDAGAGGSCFHLYYGVGVARELPRARACFERKVHAEEGCGGSSAQLDRLFLAAMLLDAQGGDAEPSRVTALLTDCFEDAGVHGLREEAKKRASLSPTRVPLDFCRDVGGTTATLGECRALDAERATAARRRVERELGPRLDADGQRLAERARDLWSAFARLEGEAFSDKYRGGPRRDDAWKAHENELEQQRLEALAHLFDGPLPAGDPAGAERELKNAYRAASRGDADHQQLYAAARAAWNAYRPAEIALYARLLSPPGNAADVKRDAAAALAQRYQALLEEAVMP